LADRGVALSAKDARFAIPPGQFALPLTLPNAIPVSKGDHRDIYD
jgi:hypothetical protein